MMLYNIFCYKRLHTSSCVPYKDLYRKQIFSLHLQAFIFEILMMYLPNLENIYNGKDELEMKNDVNLQFCVVCHGTKRQGAKELFLFWLMQRKERKNVTSK